eukprot:201200-Rhodomonas_salina.3
MAISGTDAGYVATRLSQETLGRKPSKESGDLRYHPIHAIRDVRYGQRRDRTRCLVLTYLSCYQRAGAIGLVCPAICLRVRYAMPGTGTGLGALYAIPSTDAARDD